MSSKALALLAAVALTGCASSEPEQSLNGALVVVFQGLVHVAPDLTLPIRLCYAGAEAPEQAVRAVQAVSPRPVSTCARSVPRANEKRVLVLYVSAPSSPAPGVLVFSASYSCGPLCAARFEYEVHSQSGTHWRLARVRLFELS